MSNLTPTPSISQLVTSNSCSSDVCFSGGSFGLGIAAGVLIVALIMIFTMIFVKERTRLREQEILDKFENKSDNIIKTADIRNNHNQSLATNDIIKKSRTKDLKNAGPTDSETSDRRQETKPQAILNSGEERDSENSNGSSAKFQNKKSTKLLQDIEHENEKTNNPLSKSSTDQSMMKQNSGHVGNITRTATEATSSLSPQSISPVGLSSQGDTSNKTSSYNIPDFVPNSNQLKPKNENGSRKANSTKTSSSNLWSTSPAIISDYENHVTKTSVMGLSKKENFSRQDMTLGTSIRQSNESPSNHRQKNVQDGSTSHFKPGNTIIPPGMNFGAIGPTSINRKSQGKLLIIMIIIEQELSTMKMAL